MNHNSAPQGGERHGEKLPFATSRSEKTPHQEGSTSSFDGAEKPVLRKVFRKLCNLRDTLEEIESWIDQRAKKESLLFLPSSLRSGNIVLTPENLEFYIDAERQAIVESRDAGFSREFGTPQRRDRPNGTHRRGRSPS